MICKSAAIPMKTKSFLNSYKSFKMRYCTKFYFKGLKNSHNSKLLIYLFLSRKLERLNFQIPASLIGGLEPFKKVHQKARG